VTALFIVAIVGFLLSMGWRDRTVRLISAGFFGVMLLVLAAIGEL
jgi:hypothetical protein